MKKATILFLLISSFFAQAQKHTLSGKITDAQTGETLFGVNVIDIEKSRGTTSNEYGFYTIELEEGTHTISFSFLGYTTIKKEINITGNTNLNISLNEEATKLNEVVISAEDTKANTRIKSAEMSSMKMSSKVIKATPVVLGEADVLKVITLSPGVTDAGEGSAGFNVRGGAADQNLVLLDEATIYNTSHLFGFFSVFNVDAVKDIKLYKGGIPPRFGGRVSSVLDVRQKDGNNKEFHFGGGIGLISSRLMIEGPTTKDKGSFLIAGRTSYANLLFKLTNRKFRVSFYDINAKISQEIGEKDKLFLSGYFGNDNFKFGTSINSDYGNSSFNLRWNHIFKDKLFSNLSLIYSRYNYNLDIGLGENINWLSNINNFNVKYDFNYYKSNNTKINFGVQAQKHMFNPGEITSSKDDFDDYILDKKEAYEGSLYVGIENKFGEKFSINYGARFNSFTNTNEKVALYANNQPVIYDSEIKAYTRAKSTGNHKNQTTTFMALEPRASLSYQLTDNSSVKASYQKTNQYLHLISNTNAATPLDVWTPSGNYIDPQVSHQYAIGYFKNFKENMYSLGLESYYKTVKDRVDYIDGANLIANNNVETEILPGNSRAYGLEFLLQKNKGKLTGMLAYTLSKSEQQVKGRTPEEVGIANGKWYNTSYDRTHDISLTGNYQHNKKWSFNANFVYQTGRPTNYASGQYVFDDYSIPVYTERNSQRLPAYHRLDVSATLTPRKNDGRKWKSEWVFGIYNAYNRKNAASISFRKNEDTGLNEAVKTTIFRIMPAITYNFKF